MEFSVVSGQMISQSTRQSESSSLSHISIKDSRKQALKKSRITLHNDIPINLRLKQLHQPTNHSDFK